MIFEKTSVHGAYVIDLDRKGDDRGFFARVFCRNEFAEQGLVTEFVQVNESLSAAQGTLRGMHYQLQPHAETKLVRCVRGGLWDCVLDLREESPTFGKWFGAELTGENRRMMYVPRGCAHGFVTTSEGAEALYFVDAFYAPEHERGVRWDDPAFGIEWPVEPVVVSDKDRAHPDFNRRYHLAAYC